MKTITRHLKSTDVAHLRWLALLLAIIFSPMLTHAAQVSLKASDPSNTSSLNSTDEWNNNLPPSPTNDYFTSIYFVRTPLEPTGSNGVTWTFAGNSLTLQEPSGQGTPQRSIIYKGGTSDTIIINNLTNAFGGVLNNGGSGSGPIPTFTGNLWTIAGNSEILSDQGSTIIGYPLAGSAILTNTSGQSRTITYTNSLAAFNGKFYINSSCTVILAAGSSAPGNPAVLSPDQIDIGAGCTFEDNAGLTFSNTYGGFTLAGNATINAGSTTVIAEPITDNGSNYVLTTAGSGMITLSTPSTYSGGTVISSGTLQIGVANALTNNASVTDNGTLDLNGFSTTIDGLSGSGTVDTTAAGGTPTLTVGVNGTGGSINAINNSQGTLSLTKVGAGSLTVSNYTYSGTTLVAGGTLSLSTASGGPSSGGNVVISNGVLNVDVSSGNPMPANNLVVTNGSLSLNLSLTTNGIVANGNLTFQNNATNIFNYGTVTTNPTNPAIKTFGGISAPGSTVVIQITATGLKPGTFTLIKYTGTTLPNITNFQLSPPPGVGGILINNTGNHSIDLQITSIPNLLAWNGVNGTSWDLTTPNWTNTIAGGITVFQQYTNNGVVAGDSVTFDDTLTNDFVNPQPTNITLNARFYAFPVLYNSTLPYSISGTGGILGVTSLTVSNTGSLTMLTSNSFSGGVNIIGTTLVITNDSALGASSGAVTLNGGTLQINGGVTNSRAISMPVASTIGVSTNNTASLGGVISGAGASFNKSDNGTLILTGRETFTGDLFLHGGFTTIGSGGSITNGSYDDVGQNGSDAATLTLNGTGSLSTTSDFNVGDLDSSIGTLNVAGSATLTMNAFFIGSANASGSTAMGTVNQSGGTITEVSTGIGVFCIGGRTSASAVGVYNMSGGTLTANAGIRVGSTGIGTLNQSGGTINAIQGINIARIAGSYGTNNLNGGTLSTYDVASSTGVNAVFNFNGGTLQANFSPLTTTWFSGGIQANILAGGAIIDSSNNNVTISTPLLAGSAGGGLTKKGTGTLTLTGVNTFTGPITNTAGTLYLNSASTYSGVAVANGGNLELTTASTLAGGAIIGTNAVLTINQVGSATESLGNLTFNGTAALPGGTLALAPTVANNPAVALVSCGTLTLNGTNTISVPLETVGTLALIHYSAISGTGNCTNLALPQGATGYISNNAPNSTLYAVITGTGPGIVWTGTNSAAATTNLWDISTTPNWLLGSTATTYHQVVIPGDSVTFNDIGSGTVLVSNNVGPTSLVISNNTKTYTFNGTAGITGPTGLLKLGTGTTILNLTNDTYTGNTTISNGILQVASSPSGPSLSPNANLVIGPNGTLQLSSQLANNIETVGEFTGSGTINYTGGINSILSFGGSIGGTWNGNIHSSGGAGLSLTKNGTGTWIVGGTNLLINGDAYNAISQAQFNQGTTIITNGGLMSMAYTECWIAYNAGSTSTVVVAGGTLAVSNNWLRVGDNDPTAQGTLIVNSGQVINAGPDNIDVGANGATGTLIVNGGQVLNDGQLWLGDGSGANGTLYLNGGLLQATQVVANASPATSIAYFNGGTLQASASSASLLQV